MCWACEEEAMFRRYQLELAVEEGVIPPGFVAADFEEAGLPVPIVKLPEMVRDKESSSPAAPLPTTDSDRVEFAMPPSVRPRASGDPDGTCDGGLDSRFRRNERTNTDESRARPLVCDSPSPRE